jgi:hypothetical protein
MDATNKVLRLVGHAISLDKVLTHIARLAPGSMLAGVRTHQQTSNTSTNEQHEQFQTSDELQITMLSATSTTVGHYTVFLYGCSFGIEGERLNKI